MGKWQTSARVGGIFDPAGRVAQSLVGVPAGEIGTALDRVGDLVTGVWRAPSLLTENRSLRAQLAVQAQYMDTIRDLEREIESLRKLQGLPTLAGRTRIPSKVIGFFPYENRLTLDVGSRQGVRVGLPVLAADGLVGRIQVVADEQSQVLLLCSPEPSNQVGALALRDPPLAGLLRGESPTKLILELNDPNAPVETGDLVVTSGFSERIPRGIPIGRVIQVDRNDEFGKRRASVFPSVAMGSVQQVVVLR